MHLDHIHPQLPFPALLGNLNSHIPLLPGIPNSSLLPPQHILLPIYILFFKNLIIH